MSYFLFCSQKRFFQPRQWHRVFLLQNRKSCPITLARQEKRKGKQSIFGRLCCISFITIFSWQFVLCDCWSASVTYKKSLFPCSQHYPVKQVGELTPNLYSKSCWLNGDIFKMAYLKQCKTLSGHL